jgi:hypothetical protein
MAKWLCDREQLFQKLLQASGLCQQQDRKWDKEEFYFAKLNTGEY